MAIDFGTSETKKNLMRAFAGESQARNRYTFAAEQAKQQKLHVLERIFTFTADQECAHAKIFYDFLKELSGETIRVDGGYPVDIDCDTAKLLGMAEHNEREEHDSVYQAFCDKAEEEGFPQIAKAFYMIAKIEKTHAERFARYRRWMEQGKLFSEEETTGAALIGESGPKQNAWLCLNCGHIHLGPAAPVQCPVCRHEQGYFVRYEEAPWTR